MLSPQFDELPENQLFELEGIHDDELELIDGNQELEEEEPEGHQLLEEPEGSQLFDEFDHEFDDDIIEEPSTTPTPKPMPNTASTVEIGYSST